MRSKTARYLRDSH